MASDVQFIQIMQAYSAGNAAIVRPVPVTQPVKYGKSVIKKGLYLHQNKAEQNYVRFQVIYCSSTGSQPTTSIQ